MEKALTSNIPELANTKMFKDRSEYYLNSVYRQPEQIPTLSYGLQQTRQADAPPEDLVDIESRLNNRYDIIGKSGYVYKQEGETVEDHQLDMGPQLDKIQPLDNLAEADTFFAQISGRDFKSFGSVCDTFNYWRDDMLTIQRPVQERYPYIDTRQQTKSKINDCQKF
jgi:hypothetical protein